MLKEFKNVSVNYEGDAVIEFNRKKYKIHDCIAGEDILVQTDGKYPVLAKVTKPSEYRISNGCPHQKECGGCQFMHMRYDYDPSRWRCPRSPAPPCPPAAALCIRTGPGGGRPPPP